jgi:hypothetical protein
VVYDPGDGILLQSAALIQKPLIGGKTIIHMKGISIAIETIVYIILAVLVLTILLYFLTSQAGPAQTSIDNERNRDSLCGKYIGKDITCANPEKVDDTNIKSQLFDVCKKIESFSCKTSLDKTCIQKCCSIFCPIA